MLEQLNERAGRLATSSRPWRPGIEHLPVPALSNEGGGATSPSESIAVADATETQPARRVERMPPWRVLLHNDKRNFMDDVVRAIREIASLPLEQAVQCMLEAHRRGIALVMTTHREHAELLQEQFRSKRLTVSIEPED